MTRHRHLDAATLLSSLERTDTDGTDDIGPHVLVPADENMRERGWPTYYCERWIKDRDEREDR